MAHATDLSILPCQRYLFDIPEDVVYLNCAYMSPSLKSVRAEGERGVARKSAPWVFKSEDFFNESDQVRATFATLIGSQTNDVALVPSASYGIALAAKNLGQDLAGKKILLLDQQFPSNVYAWQSLVSQQSLSITTVQKGDDHDWTRAVLAAIDSETGLVAIPQCHWTDGSRLDLEKIGSRCREVGSFLVLDLTQSLGAHPFSVQTVQPDFAVAAGYKWLLGPYSLAYLYVAPQHQSGDPLEYNWICREGSQNFAGLVDYTDRYEAGAKRYDMGGRSNMTLLPMAQAALEQILSWGIPEIQRSLGAKTHWLQEKATQLGFRITPKELRVDHMLGIRWPTSLPADLGPKLAEQNVYVSIRGDAIRIAPHLYNTERDLVRFMDVLAHELT